MEQPPIILPEHDANRIKNCAESAEEIKLPAGRKITSRTSFTTLPTEWAMQLLRCLLFPVEQPLAFARFGICLTEDSLASKLVAFGHSQLQMINADDRVADPLGMTLEHGHDRIGCVPGAATNHSQPLHGHLAH